MPFDPAIVFICFFFSQTRHLLFLGGVRLFLVGGGGGKSFPPNFKIEKKKRRGKRGKKEKTDLFCVFVIRLFACILLVWLSV